MCISLKDKLIHIERPFQVKIKLATEASVVGTSVQKMQSCPHLFLRSVLILENLETFYGNSKHINASSK